MKSAKLRNQKNYSPKQTASLSSIETSLIHRNRQQQQTDISTPQPQDLTLISSSTTNSSITDLTSSTQSIATSSAKLTEFKFEAGFNFFRIKSHSQSSLPASGSKHRRLERFDEISQRKINRQNNFLDQEIKKYLIEANTSSSNTSDSIKSNSFHTEYNSESCGSELGYCGDDVIPFDESEYEKIISKSQDNFLEQIPQKKTHTTIKRNSPLKTRAFQIYSKSLSSLNSRFGININ